LKFNGRIQFNEKVFGVQKRGTDMYSSYGHGQTCRHQSYIDGYKKIVYENLNTTKDRFLTLYINSTGGNLTDAFGLIDLMKTSVIPIRTIGVGSVMSAAFLIFSSGDQGHRYIAKNTSCMCHQYSTEIQGKFHDIKSEMIEANYTNERMLNLLVENTQLTEREVKKKLLPATDIWLQPQELIELNVADRIFGA
jgi:ATP-dependent Clp protease protease subunit